MSVQSRKIAESKSQVSLWVAHSQLNTQTPSARRNTDIDVWESGREEHPKTDPDALLIENVSRLRDADCNCLRFHALLAERSQITTVAGWQAGVPGTESLPKETNNGTCRAGTCVCVCVFSKCPTM